MDDVNDDASVWAASCVSHLGKAAREALGLDEVAPLLFSDAQRGRLESHRRNVWLNE